MKNKKIERNKWIWMPHAGHFILGDKCRFHLNTRVGKYIISTVGELWNERSSREIHASIYDKEWHAKNNLLKGDTYDAAYFKRFGFEQLGAGEDSIYETMVFSAHRYKKHSCCPWGMSSPLDIDGERYATAEDAYKGHLKYCKKYSIKS